MGRGGRGGGECRVLYLISTLNFFTKTCDLKIPSYCVGEGGEGVRIGVRVSVRVRAMIRAMIKVRVQG